jgi:hypothetical protein
MFERYGGDRTDQVDQAIAWYAALAMIKTGREKEASDLLSTLAEHAGNYRTGARRLLKRVSK